MTAQLTDAAIAEARELIAKDAAAEIRPPLPVNPLESTASEMEAYNAWWERDQNFADGARPILPRLLDALEEAGRALKEAKDQYRQIDGYYVKAMARGNQAEIRAEKAESSLAASDAARVRAERERDQARRMYCERQSSAEYAQFGSVWGDRAVIDEVCAKNPDADRPRTPRQIAQVRWPTAADSLFPDGKVT